MNLSIKPESDNKIFAFVHPILDASIRGIIPIKNQIAAIIHGQQNMLATAAAWSVGKVSRQGQLFIHSLNNGIELDEKSVRACFFPYMIP